jgi:hypothetical protein
MLHPRAPLMNRSKFKSLVHYVIASRCDAPETLGAVKLNKVLWLSELMAFHQRGQAITNTRHQETVWAGSGSDLARSS